MTLAEARKQAKKLTATQSTFYSPIKYQDAVNEFLTFCNTKNRPQTIQQYKHYLTTCPFKKNVADITRRQVLAHSAPHQDAQSAQRHILASLRVFFRWCLRKEYIEKNPIDGEIIPTAAARTRILSPYELNLVYKYEEPPFSDIIKLLMLMGQRRTETSCIHSDWIDGDCITIPSEVTKNKREHTFPYGELAQPLLQGDGNLFENEVGSVFQGYGKAKKRLDDAVNIPHWKLHDLRRTYASTHAMIGTPLHITELLLNHASGTISGISAVYNRYQYLDEKREAIKHYDDYMRGILDIA